MLCLLKTCTLMNNTSATLLRQNIFRNSVVSWNCQNLEVADHRLFKIKNQMSQNVYEINHSFILYESCQRIQMESRHTRGEHANSTQKGAKNRIRNLINASQSYCSAAFYNGIDTTDAYTVSMATKALIWTAEFLNQTRFLACASASTPQSSRFTLPLFLQVVWAACTSMEYFTRTGG